MREDVKLIFKSELGMLEVYGEYHDELTVTVTNNKVNSDKSEIIHNLSLDDFLSEIFNKNMDVSDSHDKDEYCVDTLDLNGHYYKLVNIEYIKTNLHNNKYLSSMVLGSLSIERG